jgi:hypothetical protein
MTIASEDDRTPQIEDFAKIYKHACRGSKVVLAELTEGQSKTSRVSRLKR